MIFLGIIVVICLALYFLSQNKTEKKDKTTITHKQVIKTKDGEVHIHRTQTIDSVRTSYSKDDFISQNELLKEIEVKPVSTPLSQSQPVQQSLSLPPSSNEQESFSFDEAVDSKICPNCKKSLAYNLFGNSSKNEDGLTKWCLACLSQASKKELPSNKKYCPRCKKTRLKTSFHKNSTREDGLTKWCKDCMNK